MDIDLRPKYYVEDRKLTSKLVLEMNLLRSAGYIKVIHNVLPISCINWIDKNRTTDLKNNLKQALKDKRVSIDEIINNNIVVGYEY